jgi:hypothetical protein
LAGWNVIVAISPWGTLPSANLTVPVTGMYEMPLLQPANTRMMNNS